jgi:hypothetical protein
MSIKYKDYPAVVEDMATSNTWTEPAECPFCGDQIASPGVGFVDHVRDSEDCETRHEEWCERIRGDMQGGWSG